MVRTSDVIHAVCLYAQKYKDFQCPHCTKTDYPYPKQEVNCSSLELLYHYYWSKAINTMTPNDILLDS